jgi:hypothetical protein
MKKKMRSAFSLLSINLILILMINVNLSNCQTGQDNYIIRKGPLSDSQKIIS